MSKSNAKPPVTDRAARARGVVQDLLRRRELGQSVASEQLMSGHPELMPELGDELHKLEVIQRARSQASNGGIAGSERSDTWRLQPDSFPGYQIVREIHRGGQGVVYEAVQKATKRKVAIKVMRAGPFPGDHDRIRFEREVQILASLKHPNIVAIHDSGIAAGHFYFVMDYIAGQPLDMYAASADRSVEWTLTLFERIALAVHAAHLRGVMHRDLKPGNIRIDEDGEPYILDFGLAKIADCAAPGAESPAITVTGQFVGSLPWAAPEQVDASPDCIDVRTDVYSLGVILFQILTGRFPYPVAGSVREVMDHISNVEPVRPSTVREQIDDEVDTLVLKCLSKERERRYQSAGELARDIRRYLSGEPIEAKRDSSWYVLKKTLGRNKLPVALSLAFALTVLGFAIAMAVLYRYARGEARTAGRVQAALESLFTDAGPFQYRSDATVLDLLDRGADRVVEGLKDEPEVQARVMEGIAARYGQLGAPRAQRQWLERALAIRRDRLGAGDEAIGRLLLNLGSAARAAGEDSQAEEILRQALTLMSRSSPAPSEDQVRALSVLAGVRYNLGDHVEGDDLSRRALLMCRFLFREAHPLTVNVLLAFGGALENRGAYEEADALTQEALASVRTIYPGDHVLTARALDARASLLVDLGKPQDALALREEALSLCRRLYPGDHAAIPAAMYHLGYVLQEVGRFEEAASRIQDGLEMSHRLSPGPNSESIAYGHYYLAGVYADAGDWVRAEQSAREALGRYQQLFPSDHVFIARPLTRLGWALVELHRYEEAEPLLVEALQIREKRKPPGHWKTAKTKSILGSCYVGLGRFEGAEPLLRDSYPLIAQARGSDHRRSQQALQRILDLYEVWGKPEQAAQYRTILPIRSNN